MPSSFVHLHVHSQYSILDGLSSIKGLFQRAQELGMGAIALTDHGNMYGVKEFLDTAKKFPEIKPIVGCEVYVSIYDHKIKDKEHRGYYHLNLLAKNIEGYKNLMKITSIGNIEGQYYGKPRVSHDVIEKYSDGLICCSACLAGEISRKIIAGNIQGAKEAILWHKKVFKDDYYLEVMLHKSEIPGLAPTVYEHQLIVNEKIFELSRELGVKVVATNDVHFVRKEDGPAHDRLICLTTNALIDDTDRLRYTQQEYLKSEEEMNELFPDHPEAIMNTIEVSYKVERYEIDRDPVLPVFKIDPEFLKDIDTHLEKYKEIIDAGRCDAKGNYRGDDFCKSVAYLCHLCYQGAQKRYNPGANVEDITTGFTEEVAERLDFELKTICKMGYPDYFLIVRDFIAASRAMGVSVGPGRGSAAGSAVAYCLWITNVDPIKYSLLFERFLNPDRVSLPDIDIDFDDEGRYKAFKYIEDTYGKDHVSHVVTFGTMAAKGSIKDVARISNLPLEESERLSKMIPSEKIKITKKNEQGEKEDVELDPTLDNVIENIPQFRYEVENGKEKVKEVIQYARKLEGTIRQTGVHACAMIISRGDLTSYIPICVAKDKATQEDVWVSQYEGSLIESVGMLKMDFLGLSTLSILKECQSLIKKSHGIDLDLEAIDVEDKETLELYARGDTQSVFQFESPGMVQWLQKLKPDKFEDLIAMNALYRPGPMQYIQSFVNRKLGRERILYEIEGMRDILENTYGITVYQEQVMLLSQKLAGFTKGQADKLRKAMGKKQIKVLNELEDKFIHGCLERGHNEKIVRKIWTDWKEFAKYAFNKSHSTCYAWVSFQTAYVKAHYPAEFQAANLTCNIGKQDEIKKILDDCRAHNIKVLNPDVNESYNEFAVNKKGEIRFGLGAIKGFGSNVVKAIIASREKDGPFKDIFDFVERLSDCLNAKSLECLVYSGALDSLGVKRIQYQSPSGKATFIEELVNYADSYKKSMSDSDNSLFGEDVSSFRPERPVIPAFNEDMSSDEQLRLELLGKERSLVGMYLSEHPLKKYALEMKILSTASLNKIPELLEEAREKQKGRKITLTGYITSTERKVGKKGVYATTVLEDLEGNWNMSLFGKSLEQLGHLLKPHTAIIVEGEIVPKYKKLPEDPKEAEKVKAEPNDYTINVNQLFYLDKALNSRSKGVNAFINIEKLDVALVDSIKKVLRSHKGNKPFSLTVYDPKTKYDVTFHSKKYDVSITTDLGNALSGLGLQYKVEL